MVDLVEQHHISQTALIRLLCISIDNGSCVRFYYANFWNLIITVVNLNAGAIWVQVSELHRSCFSSTETIMLDQCFRTVSMFTHRLLIVKCGFFNLVRMFLRRMSGNMLLEKDCTAYVENEGRCNLLFNFNKSVSIYYPKQILYLKIINSYNFLAEALRTKTYGCFSSTTKSCFVEVNVHIICYLIHIQQ